MLSALELVLRRLPQNIGEAFVAGDLGGAYQTVGELVERGLAIGSLTHHHIISIAGHEGIGASQHGGMGVGRHKAQRSTTIGAKGIELGQRTLVHNSFAAVERETVFLGIRQLNVVERHLGVMGVEGIASAVMYHAVSQHHLRTVGPDAVPGIAHLGVGQPTALGIAEKTDAQPLTTDAIIG